MLTSVKYNMLLVKRMKDILKKLQRVDGPVRHEPVDDAA